MSVTVRTATAEDLGPITEIYRWSVENESASYEIDAPSTVAMAERMQRVTELGLPYLVAQLVGPLAEERGLESVIGFAYASPFRQRPGYRFTVEDTVYVSPQAQRLGVGRALLLELIEACRADYRQMLAVIGGANPAPSVALHESCGFRQAGRLESIGRKFGEWHDVVILQRSLR